MTTTVYRNRISCFVGSWMSGLAYLNFQDGTQVPCDNGETVRAFDACIRWRSNDEERFIARGHTIDNDKITGLDIVWSYDEFGLILGGFTPYDDWLAEGRPELDFGPNEVEFTEDGDVILVGAEVA